MLLNCPLEVVYTLILLKLLVTIDVLLEVSLHGAVIGSGCTIVAAIE